MKALEMTGIELLGNNIDWPAKTSLEKMISIWIIDTVNKFLKHPGMPLLGASFKGKKGRSYLLGALIDQADSKLAEQVKDMPKEIRTDMSKDIACNLIQKVISDEGPDAFVLALDTWVTKIDKEVEETLDMALADEYLVDWVEKKIDSLKLNYQTSPIKAQWHVLVSDYRLEEVQKECSRLMREPGRKELEKAHDERGSALMFVVHTKNGDKTLYKRIIMPYKEENGEKILLEDKIDQFEEEVGEGRFTFVL